MKIQLTLTSITGRKDWRALAADSEHWRFGAWRWKDTGIPARVGAP